MWWWWVVGGGGSSFEKYQSEVDSGKLQFSPVHVEQFWRENSQKFEEKSFEYIKSTPTLSLSSSRLARSQLSSHSSD
jgi:hypothetical protein